MWSGLQFTNIPRLLKENSLRLEINGTAINHYGDFLHVFIFPKQISAQYAIDTIEAYVNKGDVSAIDISMGWFGLVDHVLFVYGYDDENLFVFDTHTLPALEYKKQTDKEDKRYIMKLPKSIVQKRWTRWGRVWRMVKI